MRAGVGSTVLGRHPCEVVGRFRAGRGIVRLSGAQSACAPARARGLGVRLVLGLVGGCRGQGASAGSGAPVGPGRARAAGQGGGRRAAPLLDQGRRGELAGLVGQVAPGDGDRPLAGHVVRPAVLRGLRLLPGGASRRVVGWNVHWPVAPRVGRARIRSVRPYRLPGLGAAGDGPGPVAAGRRVGLVGLRRRPVGRVRRYGRRHVIRAARRGERTVDRRCGREGVDAGPRGA